MKIIWKISFRLEEAAASFKNANICPQAQHVYRDTGAAAAPTICLPYLRGRMVSLNSENVYSAFSKNIFSLISVVAEWLVCQPRIRHVEE